MEVFRCCVEASTREGVGKVPAAPDGQCSLKKSVESAAWFGYDIMQCYETLGFPLLGDPARLSFALACKKWNVRP